MSLPIVETPLFFGKIPSTKKSFEFRPFLVKEQKSLLFALESGKFDQIYLAFKNIISVCTKNQIDIDKIPSFDAESIFLQISSKSIGEISKIEAKCSHCSEFNQVSVAIPDIALKNFKSSGATIQLTDKIGIKLKYPTMKDIVDNASKSNNSNESVSKIGIVYDTIISSIENIFDEKTVYPASDYKYEELNEFLENLSIDQLNKIEKFFEETPYLSVDLKFVCKACQKSNHQELKGIQNFF